MMTRKKKKLVRRKTKKEIHKKKVLKEVVKIKTNHKRNSQV